jgi:hypothetical protein
VQTMLDASRLPLENYKRVKFRVERQGLDFFLARREDDTELMGEETRNLFRRPDGRCHNRAHISICNVKKKKNNGVRICVSDTTLSVHSRLPTKGRRMEIYADKG